MSHTTTQPVHFLFATIDADFEESIISLAEAIASSENADELCLKIDRIRPRNGTDISQTLVCLKQRAESRDSGFKQTAIILTDGLANAGITDVNVMKTQLSDKCNNIFIGLGVDHDDRLLQQLASTQLGNNYFYIQEIEKAGLVFGEILHELLYTVISNIEIRVTGGEIYNYATNKWENELKVHALTSDAVKTYHIRSADESAISIAIYGCIGDDSHISLIEDDITPVPVLLSFEGIVEINNLARHVMRQKVLESLFEAHKYSMNNVCDSTASALIYKNLSELYANIKKYMADNMLETNEYYTMMCDDLSITLETLHHEKAAMYSGARQTSQGRQMAYNISQVNRDHLKNGRQPFEPAAQHALSAYTSCEQGRVMRECSQDENPHIGLIITGLNVNKYIGRINTNI